MNRPPPSEDAVQLEAFNSLINGDLSKVANLLRNGIPFDEELAHALADMMDGSARDYRIEMVATKPGYRGFATSTDAQCKKIAVGAYIEANVRRMPRGSYDAIIAEARQIFKVGKTAATQAHKHVKELASAASTFCDHDMIAIWESTYSAHYRE